MVASLAKLAGGIVSLMVYLSVLVSGMSIVSAVIMLASAFKVKLGGDIAKSVAKFAHTCGNGAGELMELLVVGCGRYPVQTLIVLTLGLIILLATAYLPYHR
ncbi:MAG: hypothetical protein Q8R30_05870 [bacterium]|nr:hypothetical protein [bacterium]